MENGARKNLKVTFDTRPVANLETDALVTYLFEPEKGHEIVVEAPSPISIEPREEHSLSSLPAAN